jgi:hypothetical protein
MLPYDQYQAVIFRDGLASTDPTLGMNAVNQPLDRSLMATNVQQGIAPIYNEMVAPNFYENMYQAPPINLEQKKQLFNQNLQNKKQNKGLMGLMQTISPIGNVLKGIGSLSSALQNTDFAQATSLADYLDMRKYGGLEGRETARRMNQREVNEIQGRIDRKQAAGGYDTSQDRGRGQNIPSAPKAPAKTSSAYTTASQDRKK